MNSFLDPHDLAKLEGLQLRARKIVEGFMAGPHRSPYRGFSTEFAEHRAYVPGDEIRYVDWKVFGRTDKYYVKQFEDETNLVCYLVLDVSASMRYQGPAAPLSKLEYAKCLAASLAWIVLNSHDAVSLTTYDEIVRSTLNPSSNATHLESILQVLQSSPESTTTRAGPLFHELAERFQKRGIVIILSDCIDELEPFAAGLKHLRHRQHEVALLQVLDPAELDFPFKQRMRFLDLEQEPGVITDPQTVRSAYLSEFQAFRDALQNHCYQQAIDYTLVRTDSAIDTVLSRLLVERSSSKHRSETIPQKRRAAGRQSGLRSRTSPS
ncbi:MAG: DUF58 domain-containing protein [Planctomycetaceae bacterium]|nr:DUF58 domain-containing protein [Planctomycetaceae bacterium]|tara:strand:+ start:296 stop:1264 length:969 start_codon:yes stop_codon:yes gene_type:complete